MIDPNEAPLGYYAAKGDCFKGECDFHGTKRCTDVGCTRFVRKDEENVVFKKKEKS